eukprot:1260772-Pleurochrysis_carterae.AAC.3
MVHGQANRPYPSCTSPAFSREREIVPAAHPQLHGLSSKFGFTHKLSKSDLHKGWHIRLYQEGLESSRLAQPSSELYDKSRSSAKRAPEDWSEPWTTKNYVLPTSSRANKTISSPSYYSKLQQQKLHGPSYAFMTSTTSLHSSRAQPVRQLGSSPLPGSLVNSPRCWHRTAGQSPQMTAAASLP